MLSPVRYWQQKQLEIVHVRNRYDGYLEVQVAIGPRDIHGCGVLAVPMDIPIDLYEGFPSDDERNDYLAQSAETMIGLFGDARYPLPMVPPEELEKQALAAAV